MGGGQERCAVRVLRRRATDGDDPGRRQPHAGGGGGDDEARLDDAGYLYGTRYIYLDFTVHTNSKGMDCLV